MNKKGFTMTEVIIATLIVAIVSGGMLSAFWSSQHFLNRARHRMQAFNFAKEAVDRLRSNYTYTHSCMDEASGHLESEVGTILSGDMAAAAFETALTYDVTEPEADGYKQVDVQVNWKEPSFQP